MDGGQIMSTLAWAPWENTNALTAAGESSTYLIARDEDGVTLTRWHPGADLGAAIVQIALTTIRIPARSPGDVSVAVSRLKLVAAQYESGRSVFGQPAWQPNYRWIQPVE